MITMEYSSALKNNEVMPFTATWVDLVVRKTYGMWYTWTYLENRNRLAYRRNVWLGMEVGDKLGFGICRYKLLYIKQITKLYCIA